jgi:hypothetical protein
MTTNLVREPSMAAYRTLGEDATRSLLTALRDTSWSWSEPGFPALAARLGWRVVEQDAGYGACVDPGHGLGARSWRVSFHDGRVTEATLRIAAVPEEDLAGQLFLSDVFAGACAVGAEILGPPTGKSPGAMPQMRWRTTATTIIVQMLSTAVTVFWRPNPVQDELDRIARDFGNEG